jgi:HTH-type transcriptional regulator / antitoxin HigA
MVQTTQLKAAKKFGPGYFIQEQMDLRHWTQEDLADVMGVSEKHLNKILNDKQPITIDIARLLGEIFDTSAQYWINIDTGYRLWLAQDRTAREIDVDIKSIIYERMPINDMIKKGWLNPFKNVNDLKGQVLDFWGWKELDFTILDKHLPCLTRKSEAFNQFNASYALTWYQMACNIANKKKVKKYDPEKLKALYEDLHSYTIRPDGINHFLYELNQSGVKFFVLPHLLKTYLDGAAFYSGNNPVIVYTGRYHRIDNFWFTVAHEIAHILKHLNERIPFILDDLKNGVIDKLEKEANELASKHLKHNDIYSFLEPYLGYLTTSKVEECAEKYQVHPSIIIGKLAHEKKISFSSQTLYKENVLEQIPGSFKYLK